MTIWIFAVLLMASVSLAAWRQGAIRAAFAFVGILFAALLAAPLGRLFHPLLPHLGVANPIMAWALAPVIGFIVASIPLKVAGHFAHNRVEHFYKYQAGDLRLALWERLNTRLGICIGLLNGALYFILISFFIFNLAYWTSQTVKDPSNPSDQSLPVRLVNYLGDGLQSTGFARTASAIGTLSPWFYQLADLTGLLMQNPQLAPRVADYPGFTSLWHRDDMQSLVTDSTLTNALAAGASLSEVMGDPTVKGFIADKNLTKTIQDALQTNWADLTNYLSTGKSLKYGNEAIIGDWEFNLGVTLAWLRQDQPKINANEMRAMHALWSAAYAQTALQMTGDNQIFVKNLPKFIPTAQANQPPFQPEDWKGDWSRDGTNYTLHLTLNGQDKFITGTTDGVRLRLKDGHSLLIFDHVD
ncbi:MAG: CvpA family protein [Verrucomicrobiota bacterium]